MAMTEATTDVIVVSNYFLPGVGEFREITMDFYRDGEHTFDMDTYNVTFVRYSDKVQLKISTRDKKNKRGKFDHRVVGKLYLLPDQPQ